METPIANRLLALRLLLATLAVSGALLGPIAPASAQSGDTSAVAINTKDGTDIFRFAFQIRRTMNDVVDQSNAAVAYASCTECTALAISFQVVLVMADASTVTPENLALAVNQECELCAVAAFAYQFVLGTDGPVRFSPEGQQLINDLRAQIAALGDADLSDADLQLALDDIAAQLSDVLDNELDAVGAPDAPPASEGGTPTATATTPPTETAATTPTSTLTPTSTSTVSPTSTPATTSTAVPPTATATAPPATATATVPPQETP